MLLKIYSFLVLVFISTIGLCQEYGITGEQTLNSVRILSNRLNSPSKIDVIYDNGEISEIVVNIQRDRNLMLEKYVSYQIRYYIVNGVYSSKMEQFINVSFEEIINAYKKHYSEYILDETESGLYLASSSFKSIKWVFKNPENNTASILWNPVNDKTNPEFLIQINKWKQEKEENEKVKLRLEEEKKARKREIAEEEERQLLRSLAKLDKPYHQRTNVPIDRHSEEGKRWLLIVKFKGDEIFVKKRKDLDNRGTYGSNYGRPSKKFKPDKAILFMINEAIEDKTGTHEIRVIEITRTYQPNPNDYIRYNYSK